MLDIMASLTRIVHFLKGWFLCSITSEATVAGLRASGEVASHEGDGVAHLDALDGSVVRSAIVPPYVRTLASPATAASDL